MPTGIHKEKQLNIRVDETCHALIHDLASKLRVSQAAIVEQATRQFFGAGADGRAVAAAIRRYRKSRVEREGSEVTVAN